jgi:hypothetical protein
VGDHKSPTAQSTNSFFINLSIHFLLHYRLCNLPFFSVSLFTSTQWFFVHNFYDYCSSFSLSVEYLFSRQCRKLSYAMQCWVFNKHFPKHSQGSFDVGAKTLVSRCTTTPLFVYLLPGLTLPDFPPKLFFNRSRWLFRQNPSFIYTIFFYFIIIAPQ